MNKRSRPFSLSRFFNTLAVTIAAIVLTIADVAAQDQKATEPSFERVVRLSITPMDEPVLALKYLLLPDLRALQPGNAATLYYKAMVVESSERLWSSSEQIDNWLEVSLSQLPVEEVAQFLNEFHWEIDEVVRATRRDHCRWEDPLKEYGIATRLPYMNKLRHMGRVLAVKARLEIAQRKFEDAVATMAAINALARHCAEGETLIQGLVGLSIQTMNVKVIEEFIDAHDAPNLYWALSTLPDPLVDLRKGMIMERYWGEYTLPALSELEKRRFTPEEIEKVATEMFQMMSDAGLPKANGPWIEQKLILAGWALANYSAAKRDLRASGKSEREIDELPVLQAILLSRMQNFVRLRDDVFKWLWIQDRPAPIEALRRVDQMVAEAERRGDAAPFVQLLPAITRCKITELKAVRSMMQLRTIEAIRLHTARNRGRLPARLSEITDMPVPVDPVTGKPFEYSVSGETARLFAPESGVVSDQRVLYEIRVDR